MKPISYRTSPASILGSRFPVVSFRIWRKILPLPIAPNSKIPSSCRSARTAPAQCAQDFRLQLGEPGYRGNLRELLADKNIQRALLLLDDALELCYDVAKLSLGRSALLDAAFERATLYRGRLKRLKEINQPGYSYWYECTSRHFTPGAHAADRC